MAKILIADDEQLIRKLIGDCLRKEGHEVLEAENGEIALRLFDTNKDLELALLDIMMPEIDGWEVCRRIREKSDMPVILVSARSQDFDQIVGFEAGADDYVTKPFSLVVLSRRVETLLKRGTNLKRKDKNSDDIVIENLTIKPASHEVTIDGEKIELTLKEFKILTKLCKTPGRVYTRDALLDELWGMDYMGDTRTVDSHVARLRTKLGEWGIKNIITVYGTGYKINDN
ncbi:MAG: response regulator transcription factor [Acutalibacteraceae bacterium]|nr:response regulator transcription factor [Acutalibacteraceae bacterium]